MTAGALQRLMNLTIAAFRPLLRRGLNLQEPLGCARLRRAASQQHWWQHTEQLLSLLRTAAQLLVPLGYDRLCRPANYWHCWPPSPTALLAGNRQHSWQHAGTTATN